MKGIFTSKKNPCPICGNHHGCKIQEDKWVLCLRASSPQDAPPGYRFIKALRNGMGGLFGVDDEKGDEERRFQRLKDQELKRRQRLEQEATSRAKLLSIEERNQQYRLVNQNLTLTARHRQVLRGRCLTDAEIDLALELGAVRTWNPGQLFLGVSPDLAGVHPFTSCLAGVDGITINALDPDGNITGAQLQPDNQQELGKYIWLSSQSKGGNGPHLPNGELPLFVWKHPDAKASNEVWLCEGALKSMLVAFGLWRQGKTDVAVIGTASSARYGEKTLSSYLQDLGAQTVRLMPDAGAVVNPTIHRANQQTLEWCQQWGYSITVGWWDQVDKSHPDIDELTSFDAIAHLTPEQFLDGHLIKLHPDTIEQAKQLANADILDIIGEHVELQKRGKDFVGFCPFHDEKTPSFSVSKSKQMYHCYCCGAGGNAIQFLMELGKHSFSAVVLDLARRYQVQACSADGTGIKLPTTPLTFQRNSSTDSFGSSERTISEDEWQIKFGLPAWFKHQIGHFTEAIKGFRKLPQLKSSTPKLLPQTINYIPGELPTPLEYQLMGCPVIRFAPGLRLQLIGDLVALGYHDILDSSGTGTSKSHDAGLAKPGRFGVDRLWYFSQDHRNPTTVTVEANYTDMPVRNNGMVVDGSRRTALNNPHVRWPRIGEAPTEQGNCFRAETFHLLAAKGYQFEVGIEAQLNPICATCHMRDNCGSEERAGPGHSFRNDRRLAFASNGIRASLDSAPNPKDLKPKQKDGQVKDEESSPEGTNAAIIDEAMRQLKPFDIVHAKLSDFDLVWAELETLLPEVHKLLLPVRLALRPILKGEIKPMRETYHGWGDAFLRSILGEVPKNLADILSLLEAIKPDLEEILAEPDSFNKDGVAPIDRKNFTNEQSKRVRDAVRRNSYREMLSNLQALACNWLVPFLKVWGKLERGSLRIKHGVLAVMTHNTRHADFLKAMKWVVYQDATAKREYLALYLGIDPTTIVQIEQEPARYGNLGIVQVTGLGLVGHERSDSLLQRLKELKLGLKGRHFDIASIDYKEHAFIKEGDGWWFNHNRGSNEYLARSALVSFGVPYQDIGSLQALYITLTGDQNVDRNAPGFCAFVQWQTESEIAQCVGRLRANRRLDEVVTYYSCCDFDLEFLRNYYPGATITIESAFSIAKEAGTATEQSHDRIIEAARQLVEQTGIALEKLRQASVAQAAGVTQGRISQVAAKFGGWKAYKKLLAALFNSTSTPANNSEPLDEDQKFIANTYLPLASLESPPAAVEVMVNCVKVYGWRVFQVILATTSFETRGRLLAALVSGLPKALQEEFRELAVEGPG